MASNKMPPIVMRNWVEGCMNLVADCVFNTN